MNKLHKKLGWVAGLNSRAECNKSSRLVHYQLDRRCSTFPSSWCPFARWQFSKFVKILHVYISNTKARQQKRITDLEPPIWNPRFGTPDLEPPIWNSRFGTPDLELPIWNPRLSLCQSFASKCHGRVRSLAGK